MDGATEKYKEMTLDSKKVPFEKLSYTKFIRKKIFVGLPLQVSAAKATTIEANDDDDDEGEAADMEAFMDSGLVDDDPVNVFSYD